MIRLTVTVFALAGAALALSACTVTPGQLVTSAAATYAVSATTTHVPEQYVSKLRSICGALTPLAQTAAASTSQTQKVIGQFGVAYCGKLLAGTVPGTTDSNTENWLIKIYNGLMSRGV
jgi:hypothetical protein